MVFCVVGSDEEGHSCFSHKYIERASTMAWTDERVDLLKKLWTEGLSASQIANRLGNVTRNAVIGKVHRLGLSGRATTSRVKSIRPKKRSCKIKQQNYASKICEAHQGAIGKTKLSAVWNQWQNQNCQRTIMLNCSFHLKNVNQS